MSFIFLKYIHIVSIAASFALFFVRGIWVLRSDPDSQENWVRALPYVVEALVLLSAIAMLMVSPLKGWPGDWLTFKLTLIVVYIALSLYLFGPARFLLAKSLAWLLALLIFLFVMTIAVLHNPLGIFSVL